MELKPDSNAAELGPLPAEWEVRPLAKLADPQRPISYGIVQTGRPVYNGIKCIRVVDIENGRVNPERLVTTSPKISAAYRRTLLTKGDLVIALRGKIGEAAIIDDAVAGANLTRGVALISASPCYDSSFLCQYLSSFISKRIFLSNLNGSALQEIPIATLRKLPAPVPPLPEQKAIAAALSDVDALLGALDRLIAKKRDLKQAAMQQLLTGKTRLPGFTCTWAPTTLGAIGRWFSGGTPAKANEGFWVGDIPWVSPKDMKVARIRDSIDHVGSSAIGNGTRLLPAGAILVVVRGMILAHSAPVARAERAVAFNQDIKGLVVNPDVDSNFVLWWLVAHESLLLSATNEATHGTKRIPTNELFKLSLGLPPLAEQATIAGAISDMDAELIALEQRRDKTRLLKQGMMQELLTGRTRLL